MIVETADKLLFSPLIFHHYLLLGCGVGRRGIMGGYSYGGQSMRA
jgi:hypothetical protein